MTDPITPDDRGVLDAAHGDEGSTAIASSPAYVILRHQDGRYILRTAYAHPEAHVLWIAASIVNHPEDLCRCLTIWLKQHEPEPMLLMEHLLWSMTEFRKVMTS